MTRLQEIEAELEQLRERLCCAEDVDCGCGGEIRELIWRLTVERDGIPRQRQP